MVSCGKHHTIFLTFKNGKKQAFGCGWNEHGQLGLGHTKKCVKTPKLIPNFPENSSILKICCGTEHTVVLVKRKDGTTQAFGCGSNEYGQLGLGDIKYTTKLQQITGFPKNSQILKIYCGMFYTFFLVQLPNDEIKIFGCGYNCEGQLGLGHTKQHVKTLQPIKISSKNSKILNFSCGGNHAIFLEKHRDGTTQRALGFGWNESYQLGLDNTQNVNKPKPIVNFPAGCKISDVSCGSNHTVLLIKCKDDMIQAFGFGSNKYGQLGLGDIKYATTLQKITGFPEDGKILSVHCKYVQTIFLVKRGNNKTQAFGCGCNFNKQLLNNDSITVKKLQQITSLPKNSNISDVICSNKNIFFLTFKNGEQQIFGCGSNEYGQLGLGNTKYVNKPTLIKNLGCNANHYRRIYDLITYLPKCSIM